MLRQSMEDDLVVQLTEDKLSMVRFSGYTASSS